MDPERAFTDFYLSTRDPCLRALVTSGTDRGSAEDVLAEAYARAWARWPTVSQHPAPTAWIMRVALNLTVSRWRRLRRESPEPPTDRACDHVPSGVDDGLLREIARLPRRQREVVALRVLLDLDTATTARALGISTGTVTAHLHRALTALRRHLDPEVLR